MKLYAQHGFGESDKIRNGFSENLIDGVIFSPKDINEANLDLRLAEYSGFKQKPDLLFDPQFYACFLPGTENARLGCLIDSYNCYFGGRRRANLEREPIVRQDLQSAMELQVRKSALTSIIAPNILIRRSFDSREGVISSNFIRLAREVYERIGDKRPLYSTLAVSREAILNRTELLEFVDEITGIDSRPDGFYLLIAGRDSDARTEIFNADVLASWMYLNHALTLNGYKVINGYSDIVTPFLGACGASAGATGWWTNLRTFSLNRFEPPIGGGRQPVPRYLSTLLINRITFFELDQLRTLRASNPRVPAVLNGISTDALYSEPNNSEPLRPSEILQSWDAIKALNALLVGTGQNLEVQLRACHNAVIAAETAYSQIPLSISLDIKSNGDHLEALREGIREFRIMAELDPIV